MSFKVSHFPLIILFFVAADSIFFFFLKGWSEPKPYLEANIKERGKYFQEAKNGGGFKG